MNYAPFDESSPNKKDDIENCNSDDSIINSYLDDFMTKKDFSKSSKIKNKPKNHTSDFDSDYKQRVFNVPTYKTPIDEIDNNIQPYDQGSQLMMFDDYFNKNHMFGPESITSGKTENATNKISNDKKLNKNIKKNNKKQIVDNGISMNSQENDKSYNSYNNNYVKDNGYNNSTNNFVTTEEESINTLNYINRYNTQNSSTTFDEDDDSSSLSSENYDDDFVGYNDMKYKDLESRLYNIEKYNSIIKQEDYYSPSKGRNNAIYDTIIYIILGIFLIIIFEQILKFGKYLHTPLTTLV